MLFRSGRHANAAALFPEPTLTQLRELCERAVQDMDGAEQMQLALAGVTEARPVALGYKAMAEVLVARHSYNPYTKLRSFQKGRDLLERAIEIDPKNIELRYLRMVIQIEVPSYVGYRDNISEDSALLVRFVRTTDTKTADQVLLRNIREFLLRSGYDV